MSYLHKLIMWLYQKNSPISIRDDNHFRRSFSILSVIFIKKSDKKVSLPLNLQKKYEKFWCYHIRVKVKQGSEYRYYILYLTGNVVSLQSHKYSVFNDVSCPITSGRPPEKLLPLRSNSFSSVSLLKLQYTYNHILIVCIYSTHLPNINK